MHSGPVAHEGMLSANGVFDALKGRLPPQNQRCVAHSELHFSNPEDLRAALHQGQPIVASYTHYWPRGLERYGDFFFVWTFGSLAVLIALMLLGGIFGLREDDMAYLCVLSVLAGAGLAIRYARIAPFVAHESVLLLDGASQALVYACRVAHGEPADPVVRVPFSALIVKISWVPNSDHAPMSLSVLLAPDPLGEAARLHWLSVCLTTVNHGYHAPLPEALVLKAKEFAALFGAKYVGLEPEG